MGIVSFIVDSANDSLSRIAESQFGLIASSMGTTVVLMSSLAIVLLFANMALQIKPMDGTDLFPVLIKIGLINAFAFDWVHFNYVSGQIVAGLDNIAGLIIGSITGETGSGAVFFAARFDQLTNELTDYANQIGANMNWMAGAMMSVLMTVLVAVLSGAAALMLVLSKMVVTLLVGIAPVMITLTLFRLTQDYFNRWLSALIAWSMYPIVIAGVFSIIFGLLNMLQVVVGGADEVTTIGTAIPFLAMILLSLVLIYFIPVIVRTLSGDINSGLAGSVVGGIGRRAYQQTVQTTQGWHAQHSRWAGSQTPNLPRERFLPPTDGGAAARITRVAERSERLRSTK
ncbi:type IV secretion system protein [uncultured Sulfitobacter sp.]|uniref:type IV secretion system protein n=1 Tax=uncultured Sulfitobacter sp. TaxID=191468 RepID=UPI0026283B92|nr:type IV secretion system protein [uncultured Sulfitobacter sp.]